MTKLKFKWNYGENKYQKYYDVKIGNDYLLVFANKWNPNIWMGQYNNIMIHDKTANDRQRKRQGLKKGCHFTELNRDTMLCNNSPEYMMEKVEWCYLHKISEISR